MSQLQVTGEAKIRDIQGPVVANDGVITALDGAASQYVRGDGTLADFPTSSGGGSSVSYYLNSSVSQGTIGGVAYRELSKEPIIGAGTDIAISANGYVASYLTDANDPDVLSIPGGNFNCEFYFSVNNNTGNPFFYAELYKYDGTTFTLLGSSVGVPEYINQGTIIAPYYFAIPVPTSALALTDRLAIRIYVNVDGRTVTLHTENGHLCQVVTTLSKGMVSLNNLTDQSQFLTTGTSGTNFAIVSSGDTHTFNLPIASATNTGKLSSTDWSVFNNKQAALSFTAPLDNTSNTISIPAATSLVDGYLDNLDWVKFNTAYNDSIISAAVTGTTTKTLTLNQQDGGTITASWTDDNTDAVTSVFGRTGAVVAVSGDYNTSQVTENTNLYFTNARSRSALSFAAGSGAYNSTTGVITIPTNNNQITNGSNFITLTSLSAGTGISYNNTTGVISSTITQYTDALARAAISLTTTGTSGAATYNNTTGAFNIPQYQAALTNPVTGTGTTNNLSKFTGASTIGDSGITDNGTTIGIPARNMSITNPANDITFSIANTNASPNSYTQMRFTGTGRSYQIGIGNSAEVTYGVANKFYLFDSGAAAMRIIVDTTGATTISNLAGTGTRMVVADASGVLSTQAISGATITGSGTTNKLAKFTGSTAIGDSIITATSNQVTIESTLVGPMFVIKQPTANAYSQMQFEGDTLHAYIFKGNSTYTSYGGANALNFYTDPLGGGFSFSPRGTENAVFIDPLGNLGLGVGTTLGAKLDIAGGNARITSSQNGFGGISTINPSTGTSAYSGLLVGNNLVTTGGGFLMLGGNYPTTGPYTSNGAYAFGNQAGGLTLAAEAGTLKFVTGSTIKATMVADGNLGLNETAPTNLLHLSGSSATPSLRLASISTGFYWDIGRENATTGDFVFNYKTPSTSSTEWVRITTLGLFGIGVTPSGTYGKLTVAGGIRTTADSLSKLEIGRYNAGNPDSYIKLGSTSNGLIISNAADSVDLFYLKNSGRFGIGINPTTVFDVQGGSAGSALSFMRNTESAGYTGIDFFRQNGTFAGSVWCANDTAGATNNRNALTIAARAANEKVIIVGGGFDPTVTGGLTVAGPIAKLEGNNPHHNINATAGLYAYVWLNNTAGGAGNERHAYFIQNTAGQTSNGVAAGAAYLYFGQTQNMEFVWGGTSRIQFSSAGAITAQGGFFDTSDSRLKIVVKDYEQPKGIENVAARMYVKDSRKELGYFAQDLQEILPSAVGEGADGFLTLSYSQVHTAKIAYLEKEVSELKELIKSLIK